MKESECNVAMLENGKEYIEILRIESDNNIYILLSNLDDPTDFYIRKIMSDEENEVIVKIEDRQEYEKVIALFLKSNLD